MQGSDLNLLTNAFFVLMIVATLSLGLVLHRFRHNPQANKSVQYYSWYFVTTTLFWFALWLKVNLLLSMGYSAVVELYVLASMFLLLVALQVEFSSRISKVIIVAHLLVCALGIYIGANAQMAVFQAIYIILVYPLIVFAGLKPLQRDNDWGSGIISVAGLMIIVVALLQLYGALNIEGFERFYPAFIVLLALPLLLGGIGLSLSLNNAGYRELSELRLKDPLTGLYTRRGMVSAVEIPLALLRRNEGYLGAIAMEIVDYKDIQHNHGRDVGDRLLVEVAKVLKVNTRDSDIVCHLEAGKYMVILPGENEYTELVAERLKKAVENASFSYANSDIFCMPEIGVASQFANKDFDYLIKAADKVLQRTIT